MANRRAAAHSIEIAQKNPLMQFPSLAAGSAANSAPLGAVHGEGVTQGVGTKEKNSSLRVFMSNRSGIVLSSGPILI